MLDEAFITKQYYNADAAAGDAMELSILAGRRTFMYAVFSSPSGEISEIGHVHLSAGHGREDSMTERLPSLFSNFQLQRRRFSRVYAAVMDNSFMLLPEAYAGEAELKPLLSFSTGLADVRTARSHIIRNLQFCYPGEPELISVIERHFTNATIRHAGAVNISLMLSHPALSDHDLFLITGDGRMEICARKDRELLFYNVFDVESDEDVLYYLLFMMEQFSLDPEQVRLAIAGELPLDDSLARTLKKYVRHSKPVTGGALKRGGEIGRLPAHYYFTLLNQHLCEL
jgi:hypothetical protein